VALARSDRGADEAGANAALLVVGVDRCVEQEEVAAAIPGDVDEANQAVQVNALSRTRS
jgi:hypothetical protein